MQGLRMSMSLHQSLGLTMSLTQTQAMAASLQISRTHGPEDPIKNLESVLMEVTKRIQSQPLREAVTAFVAGSPELSPRLLAARKELAVAEKKRTDRFAVNYVFRTSTNDEGKFIHMVEADGRPSLNPLGTKIPYFEKAYFHPVEFERQTIEYREVLQSARETVGSVIELTEMMDAIKAISITRSQIDTVCSVLNLLFTAKGEDGMKMLQAFLRNLVILENLDLVLSERLLKRFVHRFYRVGIRAKARDYEEMILNTIAEFTLLSMGIISPDIFELRRMSRNTEQYSIASAHLAEVGINLDRLMDHYGIQRGASFTWFNRYATRKVRSSGTSDEIIRTFITQTVRTDRTRILEILNYPELFAEFQKMKEGSDNRDEFAEASTARLTEILSAPAFQESFGQLLHRWYPKLESLL